MGVSVSHAASIREIQAVSRSGQVFVTWAESPSDRGNRRVYRAESPITAATLNAATLLTDKLHAHSANDWLEDPALCPKAVGPARGWILEEGAEPLDPSGGLFVHTPTGSPSSLYFAVLAEGESAADLSLGDNSLSSAVTVAPGSFQAIWQLGGVESPSRPPCPGKPLALSLHAHTSRLGGALTHLFFGDATMGWREGLPFKFKVTVTDDVVLVEPYDRVWINRNLGPSETYELYNRQYKNIESFWYGTNDKIYDATARLTGTPTNYTERWLLWLLDWVQNAYQTDPNRVYAFGASMGTGVQQLAVRNPGRFASLDLLVPLIDATFKEGEEDMAKRWQSMCGEVSLVCSDGMPLRDRLNLVLSVGNTTKDLPFVVIRVGRYDRSVFWKDKPAYMAAMNRQRHGLLAGWDGGDHGTAMRGTLPAFPDFRDYAWHVSRFARNRSFPAFSNYSLNENPGNGDPADGDQAGFINCGLEWEVLTDDPSEYALRIWTTHPEAKWPVQVDVTPRWLQEFRLQPGAKITAKDLDAASGDLIEEMTLEVDENGQIRYPAFRITGAQGNRLTLVPERKSLAARQADFK